MLSDDTTIDRDWGDYDSLTEADLTEAALAVLKARPSSPVRILTDGSKPLTPVDPE